MITITTLVNNTAADNLQCEHGLSFWIEYNGKYILFDTGQTNIIQNNAKQIGVNLSETDAVILSHGHHDHTGGIPIVFIEAAKSTLYLHPRAIDLKYSKKADTVQMIGMSDATKDTVHAIRNLGEVIWTDLPTEVFPGLFVTGTITRKTNFEDTGGNFYLDENCTRPDELIDDQAVFFKMAEGLAVLLGCAHAGVVNTLEYILHLTGEKNIYAVIGGMHLLNASLERIEHTIDALKFYGVQELGLAHCTGNKAKQKLTDAFPKQCFECIVGTQVKC